MIEKIMNFCTKAAKNRFYLGLWMGFFLEAYLVKLSANMNLENKIIGGVLFIVLLFGVLVTFWED